MRAIVITSLIVVGLAAPACRAQQQHRAPAEALTSGRLMAPEKVVDHIWVMRQPDRLWAAVIGNVEIIEQSDGVVLVDSGGTIADGRDVVRAVARITRKPIKAIAITHWHNDHPLGIPGILESFPNARVIATPVTAELMKTELHTGIGKPDPALDAERLKNAHETSKGFLEESRKASNSSDLRRQYAIEARWIEERVKRQMGNYAVLPTETVADRLTIPDPVSPVELRFFGVGNTHGDLVAWMPKQRVIATGDIVVLPTPYGFKLSIPPWLATLGRIEHLPFTTLIPGHGKVQHDRRYLGTLTWSMAEIRRQARASAHAGLTQEQAWARFDRKSQQRRFGARDDWTKLWLDRYWLKGMFATAYGEAKGISASAK